MPKIIKKEQVNYLSFSGSRTLDYDKVRTIIDKEIKKHNPSIVITHGEPAGVCQLVQEECKKLGIPLLLFFLEKKYGKGCYYWRTIKLMELSNHAIFIHDGKSIGTMNELEVAKKKKIPYTYYKVEVDEFWGNVNNFLSEVKNIDILSKHT